MLNATTRAHSQAASAVASSSRRASKRFTFPAHSRTVSSSSSPPDGSTESESPDPSSSSSSAPSTSSSLPTSSSASTLASPSLASSSITSDSSPSSALASIDLVPSLTSPPPPPPPRNKSALSGTSRTFRLPPSRPRLFPATGKTEELAFPPDEEAEIRLSIGTVHKRPAEPQWQLPTPVFDLGPPPSFLTSPPSSVMGKEGGVSAPDLPEKQSKDVVVPRPWAEILDSLSDDQIGGTKRRKVELDAADGSSASPSESFMEGTTENTEEQSGSLLGSSMKENSAQRKDPQRPPVPPFRRVAIPSARSPLPFLTSSPLPLPLPPPPISRFSDAPKLRTILVLVEPPVERSTTPSAPRPPKARQQPLAARRSASPPPQRRAPSPPVAPAFLFHLVAPPKPPAPSLPRPSTPTRPPTSRRQKTRGFELPLYSSSSKAETIKQSELDRIRSTLPIDSPSSPVRRPSFAVRSPLRPSRPSPPPPKQVKLLELEPIFSPTEPRNEFLAEWAAPPSSSAVESGPPSVETKRAFLAEWASPPPSVVVASSSPLSFSTPPMSTSVEEITSPSSESTPVEEFLEPTPSTVAASSTSISPPPSLSSPPPPSKSLLPPLSPFVPSPLPPSAVTSKPSSSARPRRKASRFKEEDPSSQIDLDFLSASPEPSSLTKPPKEDPPLPSFLLAPPTALLPPPPPPPPPKKKQPALNASSKPNTTPSFLLASTPPPKPPPPSPSKPPPSSPTTPLLPPLSQDLLSEWSTKPTTLPSESSRSPPLSLSSLPTTPLPSIFTIPPPPSLLLNDVQSQELVDFLVPRPSLLFSEPKYQPTLALSLGRPPAIPRPTVFGNLEDKEWTPGIRGMMHFKWFEPQTPKFFDVGSDERYPLSAEKKKLRLVEKTEEERRKGLERATGASQRLEEWKKRERLEEERRMIVVEDGPSWFDVVGLHNPLEGLLPQLVSSSPSSSPSSSQPQDASAIDPAPSPASLPSLSTSPPSQLPLSEAIHLFTTLPSNLSSTTTSLSPTQQYFLSAQPPPRRERGPNAAFETKLEEVLTLDASMEEQKKWLEVLVGLAKDGWDLRMVMGVMALGESRGRRSHRELGRVFSEKSIELKSELLVVVLASSPAIYGITPSSLFAESPSSRYELLAGIIEAVQHSSSDPVDPLFAPIAATSSSLPQPPLLTQLEWSLPILQRAVPPHPVVAALAIQAYTSLGESAASVLAEVEQETRLAWRKGWGFRPSDSVETRRREWSLVVGAILERGSREILPYFRSWLPKTEDPTVQREAVRLELERLSSSKKPKPTVAFLDRVMDLALTEFPTDPLLILYHLHLLALSSPSDQRSTSIEAVLGKAESLADEWEHNDAKLDLSSAEARTARSLLSEQVVGSVDAIEKIFGVRLDLWTALERDTSATVEVYIGGDRSSKGMKSSGRPGLGSWDWGGIGKSVSGSGKAPLMKFGRLGGGRHGGVVGGGAGGGVGRRAIGTRGVTSVGIFG